MNSISPLKYLKQLLGHGPALQPAAVPEAEDLPEGLQRHIHQGYLI